MDELGDWLRECIDGYDEMLPIQRLEFRDEITRLADEGKIIVLHGRKGQDMTYLIDRLQKKEEYVSLELVVPFHTLRSDGRDETYFFSVDDAQSAQIIVVGRYAVEDVDGAHKIMSAAEVLGLRSQYDSGNPEDEDEGLGVVVVTMRVIST